MQGSSTTWKQILQTTRVESLFPPTRRHIITVGSTDPITTAFKLLIENKILGVPVYDAKKKQYTGFIDMLDILHHALSTLSQAEIQNLGESGSGLYSNENFSAATCGELAGISRRNPYKAVENTAPILAAIDLMTRWRVHRIPVVDGEGELKTLVSQSHVAALIYKHMTKFGELADKTVEALHLGLGEVFTVTTAQQAIDAFKLIHEKGVSAVGVVNEEGVLVGNISVSDLKSIGYDGRLFARLFTSVPDFINDTQPKGMRVITVTPETTFGNTVGKLCDNNIHRVYVVDEHSKPIGVISFLEILQTVVDRS
jgi:5'-AMP-activated protein kinase regulatory gamma subunit